MATLGSIDAVATVAVTDLPAARSFYEEKLGLSPVETTDAEGVTYRTGTTSLFVYRSQYAGTNQATAVTWPVGDQVDDLVASLKDKGVAFEHYDLPGLTLEGDVHVADGFRGAWFKDPDGNIFHLVGS
jgi:catechol 2,3-dioxygenase-like lactoylglutathione lyase family enzyme